MRLELENWSPAMGFHSAFSLHSRFQRRDTAATLQVLLLWD